MINFFKENLKYLREQRNMSQNSLSKLTNVSQATINRWESGENIPTIDNVIDIASVLHIPIEDLLGKDLRTGTSYEPTDEDFKQILISKGLMNESEEISDEDFKKLVNFMMANKDFIINKKEEP